ncbi:TPA: adhesin, partial [Kluyvera georgiana]
GEECTYSAIMKLNGEITILKQISSGKNTSIFKNRDISVTVEQTPIAESTEDEEGSDIKAVIIIKTRNSEKKFNMLGYCGV